MTGFELLFLLSLLVIVVLLVHRQSERIASLELQSSRQIDMLVALLQRNGINPVTLD